MIENTIASVSGIGERDDEARADAEADEADDEDDGDRLPERRHELGDGAPTVTAWSATRMGSMPIGRSAVISAIASLMLLAQREDVAAVAHGDGKADGRLAVDAEHRLRRIGKAAPDLGDVAEAEHAAADGEVDVRHVLLGSERARHAQRQRSRRRSG